MADPLVVERVGGLAGFGGAGARLRSRGHIALETLAPADRRAVECLFESPAAQPGAPQPDSPLRDGFRYRLSRACESGTQTVEVAEASLPAAVIGCVRDELL